MTSQKKYRGRLAPTPSGLLHIGHAETFKTAWARARQRGGKIVLRIEDVDRERCREEYSAAAIDDLKSIGLDWDEGCDIGGKYAPYRQSERFGYYWSLVERLARQKLIYPCSASRAQIKKLGKVPDKKFDFAEPETLFPLSLRENFADTSDVENPRGRNWRFAVPYNEEISFSDNNCGKMSFVAGRDFGDFLVWRKSGEPSYELAVVADDAAMEITEVVRGRDLLLSTARQLLLYRALGFTPPEFFHCALVKDENGEKISKSSMDKSTDNKWLIRNFKPTK